MTTNNRGSHTVFSYQATGTEAELITTELMTKSFFLPADTIKSTTWAVHPIVVVSQETFGQLLDPWLNSFSADAIHFEAGFTLTCYSRFIGISARRKRGTNEIFLVIKPWYGKNPYTPMEGDTRTASTEQVNDLISFTTPQ